MGTRYRRPARRRTWTTFEDADGVPDPDNDNGHVLDPADGGAVSYPAPMLVGTSQWGLSEASVETTLVLGPSVRAHAVRRTGLRFDSRFMAGALQTRGVATVHLVLEGMLERSDGVRTIAPVAHVLDEREFERVDLTLPTFRLGGSPTIVIDICLKREHVAAVPGFALGARDLDPTVWQAASALIAASGEGEIIDAFAHLIRVLAAAGVLTTAPLEQLEQPEPPHLARVWRALVQFYSRHETSSYLDSLAAVAGLSVRQVDRDVRALNDRFLLHGGFRTLARVLRLRRAVLLLSARGVTVEDVARTVGYGGADAMGRAFRDAKLPSPATVRRAVTLDP